MNGPIPAMYSIKPIIHFSEGIALPTNMYKMKNIYSNFHEHKPDIIERNEHNVEEVSSDPIIEDIENRQSIILEQLKELQNQMDLLRKQLVQSTPSSPKKDSSKYSTHAVKKTCKPVFSENGILGDVVINADPKYPPYSLLGVKKIWSDSINLKISSYVHSSVVDIPNKDKLSVFSSSNSDSPADVPTLNITLVWKNIGPDCEFIVSPLISCAISGEVNVLRYIHRQVNADADILEETKLDGFLDICHCLIHASSQKEKQSFVRKLNATLGKSDWFGGSSISVSDLAAWSTIQNVDNLELVQKLSKWMEQCNKHIGVKAL